MNKQIKTPIVILLIILALIVGAYWGASVTLRSKKNASASSTLYYERKETYEDFLMGGEVTEEYLTL